MTTKKLAMVFGVIFLLLGLLGLVGGVGIVGETGVFATDSAHDWVHIITGLIFIIVSMKAAGSAGGVLKVFGIIYVLVALLGFFSSDNTVLGFMAVNGADNVLHLILGVVIFFLAWKAGKSQMGGGMA